MPIKAPVKPSNTQAAQCNLACSSSVFGWVIGDSGSSGSGGIGGKSSGSSTGGSGSGTTGDDSVTGSGSAAGAVGRKGFGAVGRCLTIGSVVGGWCPTITGRLVALGRDW